MVEGSSEALCVSVPAAGCSCKERCFGQHANVWLGGEKVDGSRTVAIFLDETAVVLRSRSSMHRGPAVVAVVSQAVDVAAKVGGIAASTIQPMALITHLVVQNIRLYFHLQDKF